MIFPGYVLTECITSFPRALFQKLHPNRNPNEARACVCDAGFIPRTPKQPAANINSRNEMTRRNIIKGLEIFEKYDLNGYVCAEHDVICGISLDTEISEEDRKVLEELGWSENKEYDSWTAFT
jgi:hypothetical protein